MSKKKIMLLGLMSSLLIVREAKAFSLFGDMSGEEIEEKLQNTFSWAVSADEKINEKLDIVKDKIDEEKDSNITYKHDTLGIVTTSPLVSPKEERSYYFVNKKTPTIKNSYYTDINGYKVSSNSPDKSYLVEEEKHHTITANENDDKWFFIEKTITNLDTYEVSSNVVLLDSNNMYLASSDEITEFGYFEDIKDVVPEKFIDDTYSLAKVKMLTSYINNLDNELQNEDTYTLKKTK